MRKIIVILVCFVSILEAQELKISKEEPLEITAKSVTGNNKTKEVIYTGNVVMKHAGNTLKSEKLTIVPNSSKIIAEKDITFINKENTMEIKGGYSEYLRDTKYLLMKDNPRLFIKDKEGIETNVKADQMEMLDQGNKAIVKDNVEMTREDMKINCKTANYSREEDKVVLEGDPVVFKKQDRYEGDKITLFTKKRMLIADSNVKAKIFLEAKAP